MGRPAFNCFLVPSSLCNPPTVPLTTLIKDDWSWGPSDSQAQNDRTLVQSYLRDCRMAFMKHVFPKFRKPVAPTAIPSWQDNDTQRHVIIHAVCIDFHMVPLSHVETSTQISLGLTLSFISLLSGERLSWSFLFLCLSLISEKLQRNKHK